MLNLTFSLIGGSVVGGLSGAQLTAITCEAFDLKPGNVIVASSIVAWACIGVLAAYNSVPFC